MHFSCQSKSPTYLDADEVHATFFSYSSGQQGLSCTRSSVQQYSRAMTDWQFREQDRVLQYIKDTESDSNN